MGGVGLGEPWGWWVSSLGIVGELRNFFPFLLGVRLRVRLLAYRATHKQPTSATHKCHKCPARTPQSAQLTSRKCPTRPRAQPATHAQRSRSHGFATIAREQIGFASVRHLHHWHGAADRQKLLDGRGELLRGPGLGGGSEAEAEGGAEGRPHV